MRTLLIDSDMLSELSRGHVGVVAHATDYLRDYGRLTMSSVTVFERLRGYRSALLEGKPFAEQLRQFELLVASSIVLSVDASVARVAGDIWAHLSPRRRRAIGDILICATAISNGLALATRNRKDFAPMLRSQKLDVPLVDWTETR